ncbi:Aste57867_8226 [Aphanomyces stellatus]|uniref:Oxidation resistance protein 1 n=1 Tax=Aphanomyces stellatus TaxID=120398 RepID=A0A485KJP3_9STRA|nr:hypothetical protein As57867_008195 [Aphanomyces stellatus]VFT85113.1 Aste57867_8226 [Aphanomyces stellatus]
MQECRKGIPEAQRASVWLYLCCEDMVKQTYVDSSFAAANAEVFSSTGGVAPFVAPAAHATHIAFGGTANLVPYALTPEKFQAFHRLCVLFQHLHGVVYCPQLVDLIPLLLSTMTDASTYVAISALLKHQKQSGPTDVYHKVLTTRVADVTIVRIFKETLQWRYGKEAAALKAQHADSDEFFLAVFHRFFVGFFPLPVVYRILDSYLADGPKIFCRVLLAVFKLSRSVMTSCTATGQGWWDVLQAHTMSPTFDYDAMLANAYRSWYGFLFKKKNIANMHRVLERRTSLTITTPGDTHHHHVPLAMMNGHGAGSRLLQPVRDAIVTSWLPLSIQMKQFRLLYDAEVHGRHLDRLYAHTASSTSAMLVLVEVLLDQPVVVGVFTSHPIAPHPTFFGDHRCFAFQLTPWPVAFKLPTSPTSHSVHGVLKYILCQPTLLSFGISMGSSAASLELDEELMRGKSDTSDLFNSPPLAGDDAREFDVGGVEVYDFVL